MSNHSKETVWFCPNNTSHQEFVGRITARQEWSLCVHGAPQELLDTTDFSNPTDIRCLVCSTKAQRMSLAEYDLRQRSSKSCYKMYLRLRQLPKLTIPQAKTALLQWASEWDVSQHDGDEMFKLNMQILRHQSANKTVHQELPYEEYVRLANQIIG